MSARAQLAAASARDFVTRATGVDATHDPRWLRLVDAALAEWPELDRLPFTLETSIRLQPKSIERRRYTLGVPTHALGAHAIDRVTRLLAPLEPPPRVQRFVSALREADHLPSAILFGLAAPDAGDAPSARIYLEQRPLQRVLDLELGEPGPAALSAEWSIGASDVVLRRYRELESPRRLAPDVASAQTLAALSPPINQPLQRVFSALDAQFYYVRDDVGGGASAFQVIARAAPLLDHRAELHAIADALHIERAQLDVALGAVEGARLRVVGAGVTRRGVPHVTLYVLPAAAVPEAQATREGRTDVRDLPRAAVVRVARADGRVTELVVTDELGSDPPPFSVANVAIYEVGRECALAGIAHDVLRDAKLPPNASPAARVAIAESRLRARLAEAGARWLGFSVNP